MFSRFRSLLSLPSSVSLTGRFAATPPLVRHAGSKAGGSTKNGRDSAPKFLGVKLPGGARVEPGNIIVRQRGQKVGIVASTRTVAFGRDWTVYALQPGVVKYWRDGARGGKSVVEVVRAPDVAATFAVEAELDAERVDAPAGASGGRTGSGRRAVAPVERYPLVRVEPWELAGLAREVDRAAAAGLDAPAMSPRVAASLADWRAGDARSRSSGGFAVSLRRHDAASAQSSLATASGADVVGSGAAGVRANAAEASARSLS